ncbi:histidine kinase [Paenibacillus filicis]|uniref:histidine kinase n=1 Tax=Paenibacillus filicis TaxID=669464 RepID=A0ABU9DGN6_9BACL
MNRDSLRPISLRSKVIITAVLCLLIPAASALSLSSYWTQNVLKRQAIDNAEASMDVVHQYVLTLIQNMIYISNKIQFDPEINSILLQNKAFEKSKSQQRDPQIWMGERKIGQFLDNLLMDDSLYITLLLEDGTSMTNYAYKSMNPSRYLDEAWFPKLNELTALETFWVGAHRMYMQGRPHSLTIARAIKGPFDKPYAYLIISLPEEKVRKVLQTYDSNQQIMIVDSGGLILSHNDSSKIGTALAYDESELYVSSKALSFGGWQIVSLVPYNHITRFITQLFRSIGIFQLILFSLFVILIVYMMDRFTKPVLKLARLASKIDSGNLEFRSHIKGRDEVGILGTSFDSMLSRIQVMIRQIETEQNLKRQMELEMLQAQLQPHFLFNILNSIRINSMSQGHDETAGLLLSLSSFLRMTINRNNEWVRLEEELETMTHYVKLMNFRHRETIRFEMYCSSDSSVFKVPRLLLQPIVENAILHGLEHTGGTITVSCWVEEEHLIVAVKDSGKGMPREEVEQLQSGLADGKHKPHAGIGLTNVYDRMRLSYGTDCGINIESTVGFGTTIRLSMPISGGGEFDVQADARRG